MEDPSFQTRPKSFYFLCWEIFRIFSQTLIHSQTLTTVWQYHVKESDIPEVFYIKVLAILSCLAKTFLFPQKHV